MSDLTFSWQYYVYNMLLGNRYDDSVRFEGDLKGGSDQIELFDDLRTEKFYPFGTGITVTYKIIDGAPKDPNMGGFGYVSATWDFVEKPMPADRREAVRDIFDEVSSFADVTFVEAADGELANISIFQATNFTSTGRPHWGNDSAGYIIMSDLSAENDVQASYHPDLALGEWKLIFRHELGHVLGIDHPAEYFFGSNWPNAQQDPGSTAIPIDEENEQFSIMSYVKHSMFSDSAQNDTFETQNGTFGSYINESYAINDIKALQFIYGAVTEPTAGDDTYTFRSMNASTFSIYDSGGIDTFDLSNQIYDTIINLAEASFSSIGLVYTDPFKKVLFQDNIGIGWDTIIENVIGSGFKDIIHGNLANNTLNGNAGDDIIFAKAGNDTLSGGAGNDKLNGGPGNDKLWSGTGHDVVSGGRGNDTLGGGAGNDELAGDDHLPTFKIEGNDKLYGGAGNDTLYGVTGNDTLWGGDGNDRLVSGSGNDVLHGGKGFDTFDISIDELDERTWENHNTITDFNTTEDKLDLSFYGLENIDGLSTETIQNDKSGVLITITESASVFLEGLSLGDITNDFLIL